MATKNNQSEVAESYEALKKDFNAFKKDISQLVHSLVDAGKEKGTDVGGRLKDVAEHGLEKAKEGAQSVQRFGADTVEKAESKIEKNPIVSVAVALGLGVLLGKFLGK